MKCGRKVVWRNLRYYSSIAIQGYQVEVILRLMVSRQIHLGVGAPLYGR
jgi:hypothetical protein